MNAEEESLAEQAVEWVKAHEKEIVGRFIGSVGCSADSRPTTIFMAGSPGAGKTEVSKGLVSQFKQMPVRIDADDIRALCPGYTGENAHIFQKAANKGVNILYDHALENGYNVILDGTFAYGDAMQNIERTLKRKRRAEIYFVYQEPIKAWEFVKIREVREHRRVSKEVFIRSYFASRENVKVAKREFGSKVTLNVLVKDYEADMQRLSLNVSSIDPYAASRYTAEDLNDLLI